MSARYMQPLRISVQFGFIGMMIWIGLGFYRFVQLVESGDMAVTTIRPPGVDGFLPISGLLGLTSWIKDGSINSVHPGAVTVLVTVLLISLLLRRSFCSWICPVGTFSELFWKTGFRQTKRNRRAPQWLDLVLRSFKYLFLIFFIYSICIAMTSDALSGFIQSDYHKLADVRLLRFFLDISPLALGVLALLAIGSVLLRNPFCRYLCPYGALLGIVSVVSPTRVTRDTDRCVSCGVCSQICPTYIDVMHKASVASPECIACWRCVSYCRFNEALSMRMFHRLKIPGVAFALGLVLLFWGGITLGKIYGCWQNSISLQEYIRLLGR